MSKDVDRNQVFKTTRVRTALKNDGSWIHKSKEDKEEQDKEGSSRTFHTAVAKRVPVRQSSYVLLTARKFGSIDSSVSPPLQNTEVIPSEGNSAPEANGDGIPAEKGAQPEGSTVETTGDTKPQAVTQNGKTEQEKSAADTTPENEEECVEALGDKSEVEHTEAAAETSAAVHVEENIQPVSSAKENPEAESPADQSFINTTAGNKEEQADPSNTDPSEAVISIDANVEISAAEISAVDDTAESKSTAEVPAALIPQVKPQEESLIKTEPATATNLEVAEAEINVQPIEGSSEKSPPEQTTGEIVAAAANVMVESSSETTDVTNATPGEVSVESVPDLLLESLTKSPTQPAAETPTEASFEISPPAQFTDEAVEAAAEVVVEEVPENPYVNEAAQLEEAAVQNSVQAHPDVVSEPPAQPAAETTTEDNCEQCPSDQSAQDVAEAVVEVVMESLPESPAVNNATPDEEATLQNSVQPVSDAQSESPTSLPTETITEESGEKCLPEQNTKEIVEVVAEAVVETLPENVAEPVNNATTLEEEAALQSDVQPVIDTQSESLSHPSTETAPEGSGEEAARQVQQVSDVLSEPPTQPAAETTTENNCEKCPADQGVQESVRAATEVVVETLPEPPAANNATPGEEAAAQPVLESPPQPAAETVVESVEGEVEPAAVEEAVLKTTAEEVVERVVNSVVEQSVESTLDSAADRVSELNIEDAVKSETAPDAGAAQEDLAATVIKLTDALDVEPPTAETVPGPAEDSEQSHSEETKVNQQCDDTNISEVFQKTAQEPNSTQTLTKSGDEKAACCFCNETIDGTVKISFSEPLLTCHPECLKCSVCAKALGDMLTPMYLHQKEIQCVDCFLKTLKI